MPEPEPVPDHQHEHEHEVDVRATQRGLSVVAAWQFATFFLLLLLIWANEILDLPSIFYGAPRTPIDILGCCVLSACVILTAIITVAHTYLQQKRIIKGLLVICSYCHKVHVNSQVWEKIDTYVSRHSLAEFSHGVCPTCFKEVTNRLQAAGRIAPEPDKAPAAGPSSGR